MVFLVFLLLMPIDSHAHRSRKSAFDAAERIQGGTIALNTANSTGSLEGLCDKCETYAKFACKVCPNCKWRGGRCMHKCTHCCAYKEGCTVDYCICDGKKNVFEDMWKKCAGKKAKTDKTYHFQVRVPQDSDRSHDKVIAMEFQRREIDPILTLHFDQEWTIEMEHEMTGCRYVDRRRRRTSFVQINQPSDAGDGEQLSEDLDDEFAQNHPEPTQDSKHNMSELNDTEEFEQSLVELSTSYVKCDWRREETWKVVPVSSDVSVEPKTDVIHLADVEYVRVFKEKVKGEMSFTTLEVKYPNSNESLKIYGGMYVPDFAHEFAMDIFWPESDQLEAPKDEFGVFVSEPFVGHKPGTGKHDPEKMPVRKAHYRVSSLYQFLDKRLQKGESLPGRYSHLVAGFVGGQIGFLAGAVGGIVLATVFFPPAGIALAAAGAIAGFALPFGIVRARSKADAQREFRLLASEKIFEKMRCHQLFKRCGGSSIAPQKGHCPH